MIIHISRERFDQIKEFGWHLSPRGNAAAVESGPATLTTTYHLLDGERSFCQQCRADFDSVDVHTPAEMETLKQLQGGAMTFEQRIVSEYHSVSQRALAMSVAISCVKGVDREMMSKVINDTLDDPIQVAEIISSTNRKIDFLRKIGAP